MYFNFVLTIAFYVAIITTSDNIKSIRCSKHEKDLIKSLLKDYEPDARPVSNASLPLAVEIKLTLKQIIDLDERNQILKTNIWLEYYWIDSNLVWKPVSTFLGKIIRLKMR